MISGRLKVSLPSQVDAAAAAATDTDSLLRSNVCGWVCPFISVEKAEKAAGMEGESWQDE